MEAHARAGIDIYDGVVRYAEVEQYGSRYRLLRLGSLDFEFDVVREVLSGTAAERVSTVAEALGDVFAGSIAGSLHVTLHPPGCYSFFSPLPAEAGSSQRKVRLQQEAALLAGTEQPLHITADAVRSQDLSGGGEVDWVHVLAVEDLVQERLSAIIADLPHPRRRMMVGMHAAASTMGKIRAGDRGTNGRGPFALALGWYGDHVEYALCREQEWYFSNYTDAVAPVDAAYFAVALLNRFDIHPLAIRHLYLYGNDVDLSLFSDLESIFDIDARLLNPLSALDLDAGNLASDFRAEAYVGCIGGTL